ncbi:hypothetical protein F53441_13767 [Fusarium austroafricanum]|uniref:Uncharacterized protein n=1 Tax=Fusarium austroafricanum TaxID=2364996 RepID=A0A8H4JP63_9HYPO|nr:hypothetical protein F53441_13767 [Fusarium austroafricanum]
MNVSLTVAGLILLGTSLWQTFHHALHLSDAVCLTLLLGVVRPSWRGAWGRKFWASDLRFSQTRDQHSDLSYASIFCGLAPWLNYILIDDVFGHPDVFGSDLKCNDRVRLSLLSAQLPVALPVIPYAVSILILAIILTILATEARNFVIVDEVPLASLLQQLNVRQMLLENEDRPANITHALDSYNKSLQNNWMDVTHYRCIISVLGRLYLIATLEHTLVLNRNEKGVVLGHELHLFQLLVVLLTAGIIVQGLAYGWLMQSEETSEDDDGMDTGLNLFQWLLQTSNQPDTWQASLASSFTFDTQILSSYFNMRGSSSTSGIRSSLDVQMLVQSHRVLRKEHQRLAREAKQVMPLRNELAFWITSIIFDVAISILAALMASLVFIVSRDLPLSNHQIVQLAALAGTVKAGLANSTGLLCKASASNFASIVIFLVSVPIVLVTVVAVLAQRIHGDVPPSLVNASLLASLPLIMSQSMMLPTFYLFYRKALLLLCFDALGGYTLIKVAENSSMTIPISSWQGLFMLFIFGFSTCILKPIVLAGIIAVEQQTLIDNYHELEAASMRRLLGSHMISSISFTPYGT